MEVVEMARDNLLEREPGGAVLRLDGRRRHLPRGTRPVPPVESAADR